MSKSLQEQLLNQGLVNNKKAKATSKSKYAALKQQRRNNKKAVSQESTSAQKTHQQQQARDRELNLQRKIQADKKAASAQIIQLIEQHKLERDSTEFEYNFSDANLIKKILVTQSMSKEISHGSLCIARLGQSYEVVPKAIADKIRDRDSSVVVVYNDEKPDSQPQDADSNEAYYAQFKVPDDLSW